MATKGKTQRKKTAPKKAAKAMNASASVKTGKTTAATKSKTVISKEARHKMIAEAAYKIAAMRQFRDADPVGDWLTAERDIDKKLASGAGI